MATPVLQLPSHEESPEPRRTPAHELTRFFEPAIPPGWDDGPQAYGGGPVFDLQTQNGLDLDAAAYRDPSADLLALQAHFGSCGAEVDAALARLHGGDGLLQVDAALGSANANLLTCDRLAAGLQLNAISGTVTLGNDEHMIALGGSIGVGLAGRLHRGDADHDGVPELGLGFDVGPLSFDVKSELLGHIANELAPAPRVSSSALLDLGDHSEWDR